MAAWLGVDRTRHEGIWFEPTVGLNISVITHLSDDVAQTLCKILFLSKSGMKVYIFFFALDNAGARIIRQPVHDSPATDIGSVIRHSNVWDTHTHTELGLAPSFEYPARSITTNQIRFPHSGKLVLQLVTTRRDKQDKRPFLYTFKGFKKKKKSWFEFYKSGSRLNDHGNMWIPEWD